MLPPAYVQELSAAEANPMMFVIAGIVTLGLGALIGLLVWKKSTR
jgi:hypothetical protein